MIILGNLVFNNLKELIVFGKSPPLSSFNPPEYLISSVKCFSVNLSLRTLSISWYNGINSGLDIKYLFNTL